MNEIRELRLELREVRGLLERLVAGAGHSGPPGPLSARDLCERWEIRAETDELRLQYLARRCRRWGLRPMNGSRGWGATYRLPEVLAAEEYGAGISKRRRHGAR